MTISSAHSGAPEAPTSGEGRLTVLVHSDDSATRAEIVRSIGLRPARDIPAVELVEVATPAAVVERVEAGGIAALVLDGEAPKEGGMALTRRLKTSVFRCPPVLLLIVRPQDRWLATWSEADSVASYPIDPRELQESLSSLLRARLS
jgi:DNA-binding response OmpR family regulator